MERWTGSSRRTRTGCRSGHQLGNGVEILCDAVHGGAIQQYQRLRWLGPLSWGYSTAVALLVNDAGMVAGYGGVYTGN